MTGKGSRARRHEREKLKRDAALFTQAATPIEPTDPRYVRSWARRQVMPLTVAEALAIAYWARRGDHWVPAQVLRSALVTLADQVRWSE